MPRFTKDDVTVETSNAREASQLRRDGFKESKARTAAVRENDAAKPDLAQAAPAKTDAPKSTK
jgi:hypothetical protein